MPKLLQLTQPRILDQVGHHNMSSRSLFASGTPEQNRSAISVSLLECLNKGEEEEREDQTCWLSMPERGKNVRTSCLGVIPNAIRHTIIARTFFVLRIIFHQKHVMLHKN